MSKIKSFKRHFKNWFTAHHGNDHLAHLLRPTGLALGIVAILVVQVTFNFVTANRLAVLDYASNVTVEELLERTNGERKKAGLTPLALNPHLQKSAEDKAAHMFKNNYWAHVAPDGTQPWYFVAANDYEYKVVGENLAKGFSTSSGVMSGWMNSDGHRANILNSAYADIGLAVVNGRLEGQDTTLVVAFYGLPTNAAVVAKPTVDEENGAVSSLEISASGQEILPSAEVSYNAVRPLPFWQTLSWGQALTIFIACAFLFVSVLNHTVVWRKRGTRLKRSQHIWFRTHPALQTLILVVPVLLMLMSGLGTVL